jgi:hypothetical protein
MEVETKPTAYQEWPFQKAELLAGMRRYFVDPTVKLVSIQPITIRAIRPAIGRIRGMRVVVESQAGPEAIDLIVKEPRGTTRTGLAGAGRREVGVYQRLSDHLPMTTPQLIGASQTGDWLLLEMFLSYKDASRWNREDFFCAIESLGELHDRFWALDEDLNAFPWLSHPLDSDFEVHVAAAAQALQMIVHRGVPRSLATNQEKMRLLARMIENADLIADPLRHEKYTLLHGDYWPGNIAVLKDSRQVVYDWQLTAVGPGILDLLTFVVKTAWWMEEGAPDRAELVRLYRHQLQERTGIEWSEKRWELLWDHALMWRFVQEWIDLLAVTPDALLETRSGLLDRLWLDPVSRAVDKRLRA